MTLQHNRNSQLYQPTTTAVQSQSTAFNSTPYSNGQPPYLNGNGTATASTTAAASSLNSQYNYLFKIVVVGDHNCGKSCILLRFAENNFRTDHLSTLGVDFKLKTIKLGRDRIRLELWDTAGMERYRTIYNSYYHAAHGVMCVYDLTNEKSFENLEYWLKQVNENAPRNAVTMLVANKADLDDQRTVPFERAERLASKLGVSLFEVSAKTGIHCEEAFHQLAATMRDRMVQGRMSDDACSEESDEHFSSAFHVDGVIGKDPSGRRRSQLLSSSSSCCSSAPPPTFV